MRVQQVVIAIIKKQDRYLLTKRVIFDDEDNNFGPYAWNIPGGGVEAGESLVAALIREAKEELGVELSTHTLMPKIFSESRNNWQGIFTTFFCRLKDENSEIVLNEEASEFGWFTIEEVKKLKTLPKTIEMLEEASKIVST